MQAAGGDSAISYSALDVRALVDALVPGEGVIGAGSLKLSQRAAGANFSVDVAVGYAVIVGDDVSNQGRYLVQSTAVENLSIPTPPVSGTRVHRVVARVKDKLHNGTWSTYEWTLEVLQDSGSGTPATPATAISLGRVSVAAGQASVLNANITHDRVNAFGLPAQLPQVGSDSARSANPYSSEANWRTDKGDVEFWTGSAYKQIGLPFWPVQHGVVTVTFSSDSVKTGSVTFPTAYASAPHLLLSIASNTAVDYTVKAKNLATTGFDYAIRERTNASVTDGVSLFWRAEVR